MLAPSGLLSWFQRLGIPEETRTLISHIRSSAPSRRVGGGKSNVRGRYPSRKMGVTIQFESHRVELAGVYEMEHDAGVRLMRNTNRCLGFSVTLLSSPNKYALYVRRPKQSWLAVRNQSQ